MEKPNINPALVLAIGVAAVSTSAILVKVSTAPAEVIAFYRLLFSVLIMLPFFILKYVSELKHITKQDWSLSIVSGIFLAFHFILWFESLNLTSVASSTVLVTLQPLFAFLGTYLFFKERFSVKALFAGGVAITGSVIISWGDFRISGSAFMGDILALVACALITIYLMFGQSVRKRVSLVAYTFIVYAVSTVTLFIYVLFSGEALHPYPPSDWLYFLLLALIPTLLGHTLLNWSVKWLSTSTISVAILFEPVGATILAYYLIGEKVLWTQVIGGLIVMAGISAFLLDKRMAAIRLQKENPLQ